MLHESHAMQSQYLADLIKHQKPVNLYLKNGRKLTGIVTGVTENAIFFRHTITEIIYKRMIRYILPQIKQAA